MTKHLAYFDGQRLAYAESGDPNGFPVLVQHGMVASINDQHLFRRLAEMGARVICVARPGYGESTPYELANVGEWGEIVSYLVDALRLDRFDVLGISSGAPYAYAIGYQLAGQARNVYILSGLPALYDAQVQELWQHPLNREAGLAEMQALARELFFSNLSAAALEQDDVRDSMRNDCFGVAQDLRIRCRNWGFTLENVRAEVLMRHSRAEGDLAVKMVERTAGLLPRCQLEIRAGDAHFSPAVLDDFIETVIGAHFVRVHSS